MLGRDAGEDLEAAPTVPTPLSKQQRRASLLTPFVDGGNMGALMRSYDWAASPLGPVQDWPPSLCTTLGIALNSQFPTVLFWGAELVMLYNDAYLPMLADKHPAALGQPARAVWPEIWAIIGPMLQSVLETGQATWSQDLLLPIVHDGAVGEYYFTFSYSPILDETGRVYGVFCPVTETTDRVKGERREKALRQEAETVRAQLTMMLESMTDGFYSVDHQWRFTYVNHRAKELWKRPHDDFLGKNLWDEFPAAAPLIFGTQLRRAMTEQVSVACEGWYPPMDVWLAVHIYPTADGLTVYFQDVTARKQVEAERERLFAELRRINEELQQFARIVSHDLTEPLRTMRSFVQLLARQTQGQRDPTADEYMGFITDAARRMQQMLTDLLAYTRAGETHTFQVVDCEALLAHILESLQVRIAECGAVITHEPLPPVFGDGIRLGQVFQNLIGNALKFCNESPPRIHLTAQQEHHQWRFAVQDNGIGIELQQAERIFQVFQRLHARQAYEGTGIGLAICKRIIEQHGGRIWVESTPGHGATFFFTLPAAPGATTAEHGQGQELNTPQA